MLLIMIILINCTQKPNTNSEGVIEAVRDSDSNIYHFKQMPDGKLWLTENVRVNRPESFCQNDSAELCNQYGRLYSWSSATIACNSLGNDWRLPTNEEWQALAKHYGGVYDDSEDKGKSAYFYLLEGGSSGFNALLGGNREANGNYERLGAHGFYWTSTEYDSTNAWFYNFGIGSTLLNHHTGDKQMAVSVRCIKDL